MPGYKRIVSYIYTYEGGERKENTGFVKLEARDGECRVAIHMKGSYFHGQRPFKAYLYAPEKDSIQGMLLGELESGNGALEWKGSLWAEDMARMPYSLDKIQGVFIEGSGGKAYASQWNDLPVKVDSFQIYQEARQEAKPEGHVEKPERLMAKPEGHMAEAAAMTEALAERADISVDAGNAMPDASGELAESAEKLPEEPDIRTEAGNAVSDISVGAAELQEGPQEESGTRILLEDVATDVSAVSGELAKVEKPGDIAINVSVESAELTEGSPRELAEAERSEDIATNVSVESAKLMGELPEKLAEAGKQGDTATNVFVESAELAEKPQEENVLSVKAEDKMQEEPATSTAKEEPQNVLESSLDSMEAVALEGLAGASMAQERSQGIQGMEEAFPQREKEPGNSEMNAGRKTDPRQEKWDYLARRFPVQRLFQRGKAPMACIRIGPRDLQRLPRGSWILGNNSFLLHGYYQYRHLLLCRQEEAGRMEYYLAVPGVYNEKEEMMAKLFGFDVFHRIGNGGNRNGNYGYWFRRIEENATDDNR